MAFYHLLINRLTPGALSVGVLPSGANWITVDIYARPGDAAARKARFRYWRRRGARARGFPPRQAAGALALTARWVGSRNARFGGATASDAENPWILLAYRPSASAFSRSARARAVCYPVNARAPNSPLIAFPDGRPPGARFPPRRLLRILKISRRFPNWGATHSRTNGSRFIRKKV